jgi:hypothetical protein
MRKPRAALFSIPNQLAQLENFASTPPGAVENAHEES